MPGTVTCTTVADLGGFLIDVDWTGDTHPTDPVKISRRVAGYDDVVLHPGYLPEADGNADFYETSCGRVILYDFTAPMDVTVQYVVEDPSGDVVVSAGCTFLSEGHPWLIDFCQPCNNLKMQLACDTSCPQTGVIWLGYETEEYASASTQFDQVGDRYPIDISEVRKQATTVIGFVSLTCEDRDKVLAITASGRPVLFQAMPEQCWPMRWLALGKHTVTPLSRDLRRQQRLHTIPAVVVRAPEGPGGAPCGTRWVDLCPDYPTWDDLDAAALTGVDILSGANT